MYLLFYVARWRSHTRQDKWRVVINNMQDDLPSMNRKFRGPDAEDGVVGSLGPVWQMGLDRRGTAVPSKWKNHRGEEAEDELQARNLLAPHEWSDEDDQLTRQSLQGHREVMMMTSLRRSPYDGNDEGHGCRKTIESKDCGEKRWTLNRFQLFEGGGTLSETAKHRILLTGPSFVCRDCLTPVQERRCDYRTNTKSPAHAPWSPLSSRQSLSCSAPDLLEASLKRPRKWPQPVLEDTVRRLDSNSKLNGEIEEEEQQQQQQQVDGTCRHHRCLPGRVKRVREGEGLFREPDELPFQNCQPHVVISLNE